MAIFCITCDWKRVVGHEVLYTPNTIRTAVVSSDAIPVRCYIDWTVWGMQKRGARQLQVLIWKTQIRRARWCLSRIAMKRMPGVMRGLYALSTPGETREHCPIPCPVLLVRFHFFYIWSTSYILYHTVVNTRGGTVYSRSRVLITSSYLSIFVVPWFLRI